LTPVSLVSAVDSVSLTIGLLFCAGLAVLAWVIDPRGLPAWRERAWFALARDLGLRYRARTEPMGPRLAGEYKGVELDIDLRATPPCARMVLASPQRAAQLSLSAGGGQWDVPTDLPTTLAEATQEAIRQGEPAAVEIVAGVMTWRWSTRVDGGRMRRDLNLMLPLAHQFRSWLLDAEG